jgi:hypothetical protein
MSAAWIVGIVTFAALTIKKLFRDVTLPTAPLMRSDPAPAVTVRLKLPSTVLPKVRLPPPLLRDAAERRVMGDPNWRDPEVETFVPRETPPPPLCAKVPLDEIGEESVADPEFTIETDPPPVEVKLPLRVNVPVVKLMLPAAEIGPDTVVEALTVVE